MSAVLQEIGFTQEELRERVIERICDRLLHEERGDEDGHVWMGESEFRRKLDKAIQGRVDATIQKMADAHVLPNVAAYIENLTLQETNKWGEANGPKVTFVEYLVQRAEAYLTETVNHEGKPKGTDSYSWRGTQTRITHLIHQHLHYSIETAMKDALKTANSAIAEGIEGAVKLKLAEIVNGIKATVTVKN